MDDRRALGLDADGHARTAQLGAGVPDKGTVGGVVHLDHARREALIPDALYHCCEHFVVIQLCKGLDDLHTKRRTQGDHDLWLFAGLGGTKLLQPMFAG